ncbi:MAG: (d)CMP kinase [Limnobacter sp.]|nr:(d)CMP kinase [Limnobacter sp.]
MEPLLESQIPIIAIDGPTASGKGTVAARVAQALHFNYLDSGALYRVLAVDFLQRGLNPDNPDQLAQAGKLALDLPVQFTAQGVFLAGHNVSTLIRTEEAGAMASRLAVHPPVRQNLLQRQRDFLQTPGLVADGRDMGSVVFPQAGLKVFLTASPHIRAQRRFNQLQERGLPAAFDTLLHDLQERDRRDSGRAVAPLKPAHDARLLDCSALGVEEVVQTILAWYVQHAEQGAAK